MGILDRVGRRTEQVLERRAFLRHLVVGATGTFFAASPVAAMASSRSTAGEAFDRVASDARTRHNLVIDVERAADLGITVIESPMSGEAVWDARVSSFCRRTGYCRRVCGSCGYGRMYQAFRYVCDNGETFCMDWHCTSCSIST